MVEVPSGDVIGFRMAAHRLTERLPEGALLEAAGRCGVQDSPPGSASLALNARVRNLAAEQVADSISGRSLLRTWSMRGAPFSFPVPDAPVFTAGVLPPTEQGRRHLIRGVEPALARLGIGLDVAVGLAGAAIREVLRGRRLPVNELGAAAAARIAQDLAPGQRDIWDEDGPYAAGQSLGEGVVHFCIRILTLQGVVCFAPRAGNTAPFVLVEEWLGHPIPDIGPDRARAELLRRFLRCYGPTTRADFAAWLGIGTGDVDPCWSLVAEEMMRVEFGGERWILTEDLEALRSSPAPRGLRLLPPRDPYTQLRDRETILDTRLHREVWAPRGAPGALLIDGLVAGAWRPRTRGRELTLTVTPFRSLTDREETSLHDEAEGVARLRGVPSLRIVFAGA